jgi:hypothetical protein
MIKRMKRILYLMAMTAVIASCSKNLIPNSKGDDSLIGAINKHIKSGTIKDDPLLLLGQDKLSQEDLALLNQFPLKDFTSVDVLTPSQATKKYNAAGKSGAVEITPFVDETLSVKYYEKITNQLVVKTIKDLAGKGLTKENPIIVLDGKPLRGEEIADEINALVENGIKTIELLKKPTGYSIYGIRAISGVILLTSKH